MVSLSGCAGEDVGDGDAPTVEVASKEDYSTCAVRVGSVLATAL